VGEAAETAGTKAKDSGSKWDSLMGSFTGINQAIGIAKEAYATLKGVYDEVITKTVDYADEVRELSRLIGATPEDASKLIQAADDVFISFDSLTTAMTIAIKNGIEPTVEGMGELADEYLAIEDPIDRTKFLLENFGRAGADLGPLMELGSDGIKELGDAAEETGLVLDQDALDATLAYKEGIDSLTDSWTGFMTNVGVKVIPVLVGIMDALNQNGESLQTNKTVMEAYERAVAAGVITEEQYKQAQHDVMIAVRTNQDPTAVLTRLTTELEEAHAANNAEMEATIGVQGDMYDSILNSSTSWEDYKTKMAAAGLELGLIDKATWSSEKALSAAATKATEMGDSIEDATETDGIDGLLAGFEELTAEVEATNEQAAEFKNKFEEITGLTKNFGGMISYAKQYDESMGEINDKQDELNQYLAIMKSGGYIDGMAVSAEEAKGKVATLTGEIDTLKQGMTDMANQAVLDMLMATYSIDGISKDEAAAYFKYAEDMNLISAEAADAAIENYKRAVDFVEGDPINADMELDSSEVDNYTPPEKTMNVSAKISVDEQKLKDLTQDRKMVVNIIYKGVGGGLVAQAVGGSVYEGNPYNWQEYGYRGELFVPSSNGFVLSRADAERAISSAIVNSKNGGGSQIDAKEIGRAVASALGGVLKSGQGQVQNYNLNLTSYGNPEDVLTAFELMRALGV
jgi:hypothetical protein